MVKSKKIDCFVIMPFSDPQGYEAGHFTQVYQDIIKPACDGAGVNAFREDSDNTPNVIHVGIVQKLINAPLAICDLSSRNPNVMFELGIRQAFCLPTVLMADTTTTPIFDVSLIRCMPYDRSLRYRQVLNDQKRLAQIIKETLEAKGSIVNSVLEIAKIPSAKIPTEIQNNSDVANLLQKLLLKIDSLPLQYGIGAPPTSSNGNFEIPGLSNCEEQPNITG